MCERAADRADAIQSRPAPRAGEASWAREPEGDSSIEENWLLRLRRERSRSRATGKAHDFYVVHLADAVHVIALTSDRQVLLVEQFRAGSGADSLETPGGLLDAGEDPLEAGARELLEETGFAGDPPRLVSVVWANPSLLTSRLFTILITNARRVANPKLDHSEELHSRLVPAKRIPDLIRSGKIGHALCVQGLLWWLASELPASPLGLAEDGRSGRWQFHLGGMMGLVLALALVFALLRGLMGSPWLVLLPILMTLAVVPTWYLLTRWIDPRSRSILLRDAELEPGRQVGRLLSLVGLATVLLGLGVSLGRLLARLM